MNAVAALKGIIELHLTDLQQKVCNRVLGLPKFQEWPASTSKHHVWPGGLAEHTLQVVRFAMALTKQSSDECHASYLLGQRYGDRRQIDPQIVIVAALFHDLGKIDDYDRSVNKTGGGETITSFFKTKHFGLIHHLVKSSDYFLEFSKGLLDAEFVTSVQHCILAHHGRKEYGSPVTPATREAWVVHLADMASAQCVEERKND